MLLHRISPQRLAIYLQATEHDLSRAIALYAWNSQVSAALFEVFGHVEVVLRNAIHEHMTSWSKANGFGENWLLNQHGLLDSRSELTVRKVMSRLVRSRVEPSADRLIVELNLGFWRFLLTSNHQSTLWAKVLRRAFPNNPPHQANRLFARVGRVHLLRNRIAHHEPLVQRRVDLAAVDSYLVIGAVCRETEEWVRKMSRVESILRTRPH